MKMKRDKDVYDDDGEVLLSKYQLDAVLIDDMSMDDEMTAIPAQLAYWNAMYTAANRDFLIARHELRIAEAQMRLDYREETKADKPKPTVDDITAMIHTDPEYKKKHMDYVLAEAEAEKLKKFAEAVAAKLRMLQSIGAKMRAEWDGDPATRRQHREAREDRERDDREYGEDDEND